MYPRVRNDFWVSMDPEVRMDPRVRIDIWVRMDPKVRMDPGVRINPGVRMNLRKIRALEWWLQEKDSWIIIKEE